MKHILCKLIIIIAIFFLTLSCSKSGQPEFLEIPHQSSLIPEQAALLNLDFFLGQTKSAMCANDERTISAYSFDDDSSNNPDLYLVNYSDESGCAILAANTQYPDILAVLENGNIDDNLQIVCSSDCSADESSKVQQLINTIQGVSVWK